MAYLKFKYPLQFFTTLLSSNDNSADKIAVYVADAKKCGINICQPNIQDSHFNFSIKKSKIIFGFNAIKGIGRETINKILTIRNQQPKKEFKNMYFAIGLLANNSIGIKTVEILVKAGCFDCFLEKNQTRLFILKNLEEIFKASRLMKPNGEFIISPNLVEIVPVNEEILKLQEEQFNLLGVNFAEHPVVNIRNNYKGDETILTLSDVGNTSSFVHCFVVLDSFREIKTKTGLPMAFAKIEDDTKVSDVVIFPGVYTKAKSIIKKGEIYLVCVKSAPRGLQLMSIKEIEHE